MSFQDRDAGGVDAGPEGSTDAGTDAGPPSWDNRAVCGFAPGGWTLSAPEAVSELNSSSSEGEMHLMPDGLTMFLSSDRGGDGWWVYATSRATTTSPFDPPELVPELSGARTQYWHLAAHPDLRHGVVTSDRTGTLGLADIFILERAAVSDPWTVVRRAEVVNTARNEHDPWLSPDGLRLYFTSDGWGEGPGGQDLVVAERPSLSAPFETTLLLDELNTADNEDNPMLTQDELTIVFGSNRPGGAGDLDLYIASRASRTDPFGVASPIAPLNSDARDGESFISADGCELYFSSTRGGGDLDIYRSLVTAR